MRIRINGSTYTIPASLMDITLQQRVDFDIQYGKALKKQLAKIIDMKDGIDRELEFTDYHLQLACQTLSFFGKIPLDVVRQTQIEEVLTIYHHSMKGFSEDVDFADQNFQLQHEFNWMDETWQIAPPALKHDSRMDFGEFLDAKQIVKNLFELGDEKWGAVINLACIYFRRKDEEYDEALIKEDGERYRLMQKLPLQYGLHVGFFLRGSMDLYLKTFHSSSQETITAGQN